MANPATIRSMVTDNRGRLWIGTFGNGLWLKKGDTVGRFSNSFSQQPYPMINNLLVIGNKLWIASAGSGCSVLNTDTDILEEIGQTAGFLKLHAIALISNGTLLIGSVGSGTAFLERGRWEPVQSEQPINLAWVNSILEWNDRIWLGTSTGLYSTATNIKEWKPRFESFNRGINNLLVHDNKLYIATVSRGLYLMLPGVEEPRPVSDTFGTVNFLISYNSKLFALGEDSLWNISNTTAKEIDTPFTGSKCAVIDSKKNLLIGTISGKIYTSVNGINFKLTHELNGCAVEESDK